MAPPPAELKPHVVALEATGGFETVAAAALSAAGLPVVVVNPAQIRHFAQAVGQRAKTDPIDAAVIAHFAAREPPGPLAMLVNARSTQQDGSQPEEGTRRALSSGQLQPLRPYRIHLKRCASASAPRASSAISTPTATKR
jgi:transposase